MKQIYLGIILFITLFASIGNFYSVNNNHVGAYQIKSQSPNLYTQPRVRTTVNSQLKSHHQNFGQGKKPTILCTGLGVVNGLGVGIETFWKNAIQGVNRMDIVKRFDPTDMLCQIACEVSNEFEPTDYFNDGKDAKRNDRYTHFAVAATRLALQDAGLKDISTLNPYRVGVIIGSGIGGISFMEDQATVLRESGPRRVSPFLIPAMIANTAPGQVAIEIGAKGPNYGAVSACATSGHAIGTAIRLIQAGDADMVICGGAEAAITRLGFAGFNALRAMAVGYNDNPKKACRPFDKKRSGFVMGEGSGIIILESEEHAVKRMAPRVYGEVAGYGANCDAHHITAPSPGGVGLSGCLELAIQDAGIPKEDIGYINAHGTSTPMNDRYETAAFKRVFGDDLAKKIFISSTKSMTGHCLGAVGGIETAVIAKVLETGTIPPTLNYEVPDPECDLNYTPNVAVQAKEPIKAVLSDTLGFGGHNAALVMRRYQRRN